MDTTNKIGSFDRVSSLYQNIKDRYDVGDLKTFAAKMQIPEKRKILFDTMTSDGYDTKTFEHFSDYVSLADELNLSPDDISMQPDTATAEQDITAIKGKLPTTMDTTYPGGFGGGRDVGGIVKPEASQFSDQLQTACQIPASTLLCFLDP